MAVTLYQSTDASAPTLTGQVGSLTSLLDAILVNGYGSKSAAGWTIAYTGTNQRQYAMASGGTGRQLFIDDSGPGGGGAREARATGWVGGSGLNAGTRQFPTTSQMTAPSGALVIRKSTTADSTTRMWRAIADGHTLYLMLYTADWSGLQVASMFCFGDFFSYNAADVDNCHILGRTIENNSSHQFEWMPEVSGSNSTSSPPLSSPCPAGHYADASYTGVGGSVPLGHVIDFSLINQYNALQGTLTATLTGTQVPNGASMKIGHYYGAGYPIPYPNPVDGSLWMCSYKLAHTGVLRGYLKGCWVPLHDRPLNDGDTFTVSSGPLNGKTFMAINIICNGYQNNPDWSQIILETSNTWL